MPILPRQTIGIVELVSFGRRAENVPAKIDTGADSSAIWATNIRVGRDGVLRFSLFGEGSKYYNGKIFKRSDFDAASVKSSNGQSEIRYRTHLVVTIAGRKIRAKFNLSDRAHNTYKVLIGRRTISGKFVVDVGQNRTHLPAPQKTKLLNKKLRRNSYEFHKKYVKVSGRKKL
jgi:hypothetical protein